MLGAGLVLLCGLLGLGAPACWAGGERRGRAEVQVPAEVPQREPVPAGEGTAGEGQATDPAPTPRAGPTFLGESDDAILERICRQPVKSVRPLGGGASISLKVVFADGSMAAVKPDQVKVTRYQSEVAAYLVARALGLSRVAPSCVRQFPRELLMQGMPQWLAQRMTAEMRADDKGLVACAVIAWIPNLHELKLESERAEWGGWLRRGGSLPAERRRRALDIGTMVLFDYLIVNDDRWSGGQTHEAGQALIFLDQGAAFGSDRYGRRQALFSLLRGVQRFDKDVVAALRGLDVAALQATLRGLLTTSELQELAERIDEARRHVARQEAEAPQDSLL